MESVRSVAGVYVERTGVTVNCARTTQSHIHAFWEGDVYRKEYFPVNKKSKLEAKETLKEAALWIASNFGDVDQIAVAAYGPFLSTDRKRDGYGCVHPIAAHAPFNGISYLDIFESAFRSTGQEMKAAPIVVTDAQAGAVGEAILRDTPKGHLLAYLIVEEGIGLGLVSGRRVISSALHPEIGLIHLRLDPKDRLISQKSNIPFSLSLAELAGNSSIKQRAMDSEIRYLADDKKLWNARAYYLAQAALACVSILPPHQIAIAADIDPNNDVGARTRRKFKALLKKRKRDLQPLFEYEELKDSDFITCAVKRPDELSNSFLAKTGAIGACYIAADSIGARDVNFLIR